ncbi:MAG: hypothetical protein ACOC6C_01615 [Verrucomicrobiota bacterium]
MPSGKCPECGNSQSKQVERVDSCPQCGCLMTGTHGPQQERPSLLRRFTGSGKPACSWSIQAHAHGCNAVAAKRDGSAIVTIGGHNLGTELRVWDVVTGKCRKEFSVGADSSRQVLALFNDDKCAIANDRNMAGVVVQEIHIYSLASGSHVATYTPKNRWTDQTITMRYMGGDRSGLRINDLLVTSNNRWLIAATNFFHAAVFDTSSGECVRRLGIAELPLPFDGHASSVTSLALTTDGSRLLTGGEDDTIRVWDLDTCGCLATIAVGSGGVASIAVTADDRHIVSLGSDSKIRTWDLRSGACLGAVGEGVTSFALVHDAGISRIVSTDYDDTREKSVIQVWNLPTCKYVGLLGEHTAKIDAVVLLGADAKLATSDTDGSIKLWDLC